MSLHAASTGLVLDAFTKPTPSSVNSKRLAHASPKSLPGTIDSPAKATPVKLARTGTRVPPNHVPDSGESTPTAQAYDAPRSRPTSLTTLFSIKGGKLQHAYPRSLAPYPSNYDRSVMDCDVLDQAFLAGLHAGSPTMLPHISLSDPTTHPRKTLDLGCGSGAWIISAASVWPQTRFVGFDLVPQITNLSVFEETSAPDSAATPCRRFSLTERRALKSSNPHGPCGGSTPTHRRLSERVRFVHGNFLINGLPFEDGEFDHVRIVGIARGVPEKKWDYLLAEVHRVLCDGGHLEMIEEDIIFPILPRRIDAPAQRKFPDEDLDEAKLFYRRPTHVLHHSTSSIGSSSSNSALHMSKKEDDVSHSGMQSTSSRRTFVPSQPLSVPMLAQSPSAGTHSSNLSMNGSSRPLPATNKPSRMAAGKDKPLPPPPSFKGGAFNNSGSHPDTPTRASLAQPGQTSSHSGNTRRGTPKSQSMQPIRPASAHNPQRSGSNVQSMTPNFQSMQPIRPASAHSPPRSGPNVQSMAFSIIGRRPRSARESRPPKKESIVAAPPSTQPLPLKVPRSQSVEPVTRHEHAVLEILFKSVFEGRFINTSPTAILPSYLNVYFKNLKPSPRVDMPTPPAPERRIKDVFGTEDVNVVPLKPALEGPLQPAAAIANRYPAPQTYQRSRSLLRSASTLLRPTEQLRRPRDLSASSESEESDFTYWSARSLVTPITPLEESKGIEFVKGGEYPGENNKKTPSSTLLPMFDEEDDAREAITSPTSNWARLPPETGIVQEDEAPITLDAALAAIERHDHFYNEPLSASRWRSVDVGGLRSTYQRKPTRCAEKYACQSYTRVKARDSVGSVFCFVLPRALFKLDERDMGLHLRKTYMGVIACREAMWEELQRRAEVVTGEHGAPYRTTLLDRVKWSSQERLMSDAEKFDLLFERFESDMREWCSVGPSLSAQLWSHNNSPFAAPQQKGLKCKISANSEFNEPLVGRDISRILRVFVARKPEIGSPFGRRGSQP